MGLQSNVNSALNTAGGIVNTAVAGKEADHDAEVKRAAESARVQKSLIDRQKEAMARVEEKRKAAEEAKKRVTQSRILTASGTPFVIRGGTYGNT